VLLGAVGLLEGRQATTNHNSLGILSQLGASDVFPDDGGVVIDGNLYTSGPGVRSFEVAVLVVADAFGTAAAQLAEVIIEHAPHRHFDAETVRAAGAQRVEHFEGQLVNLISEYREGAIFNGRVTVAPRRSLFETSANASALVISVYIEAGDGIVTRLKPLRSIDQLAWDLRPKSLADC